MMKIKFQTLDTSYPSSVSRQRRRAPQTEKTRENYGNYDTVMINGPRINQEEDNSFASSPQARVLNGFRNLAVR